MPTATGKAWYRLRKTASKLARMEHHYTFLKACCEENLIPHGLNFKTDVGLRLYPWMLEKYSVEKHAFISHRIQDLASDAYIIMTDLHAEFFSVKSDVQRRFRAPICNQLFKRARAFLNYERRQLKSREQLKLYKLHRNSNTRHRNSNTRLFTGHTNSLFGHPNRQCSQSTGNFEEYDFNISYNSHAEFSQTFVTDFDYLDFDDCSYNYLWSYNSKNFVDFSEDLGQPIPLNQQPDRNNKASSRTICNRRFDKQRRKRSSRGSP